jgi:sigma-70-like protein
MSTDPDAPILDMSDPEVRKLIKLAKRRGHVTYDELNAVLPGDITSEQIEDLLAMLTEAGIAVVESEFAHPKRGIKVVRPTHRFAACSRARVNRFSRTWR